MQKCINNTEIQKSIHLYKSVRDSSGGTVTHYGLESPGIESQWGRDFSHSSTPTLRLKQPPVQWVPGDFSEGIVAGTWHSPPTLSSAEVKERETLYLQSSSGPSWPVLEQNLLLPIANQFLRVTNFKFLLNSYIYLSWNYIYSFLLLLNKNVVPYKVLA